MLRQCILCLGNLACDIYISLFLFLFFIIATFVCKKFKEQGLTFSDTLKSRSLIFGEFSQHIPGTKSVYSHKIHFKKLLI